MSVTRRGFLGQLLGVGAALAIARTGLALPSVDDAVPSYPTELDEDDYSLEADDWKGAAWDAAEQARWDARHGGPLHFNCRCVIKTFPPGLYDEPIVWNGTADVVHLRKVTE